MSKRYLSMAAGSADEFANGTPDTMANFVRLYNDDVDEMMGVLVPSARYRKEHYAYGKFTVPEPHGLHTDHSAEDPDARENRSASPGSKPWERTMSPAITRRMTPRRRACSRH